MSTDHAGASDGNRAARDWVRWIASGECTEGEFITHILLLEDDDRDVTWEVLALLDQMHRRRQIDSALFNRIKARLQLETLGYGASDPGRMAASTTPARVPAPPEPRSPAPVVQEEKPRAVPPDLQREPLVPGDLLKGRYRVVQIARRTDDLLIVEALDEVRAELPDVRQSVAIHLISDERSRDIELVQRIYRQQLLAHPAIDRIFDINEDDGELFFTTEWLGGSSLQQRMQQAQGGITPAVARSILGSVASALRYAHAHDVFHGDVSAENIHLTDSGEVRLRGFRLQGQGIAAGAATDQQAFAWVAYETLWRSQPAGRRRDANGDVLQKPPGMSRSHWRVLKDVLHGKGTVPEGALLDHFAAADGVSASVRGMPPKAPAAALAHQSGGGLLSAVMAGVVVCSLGGYLLLSGTVADDRAAPGTAVAAALQEQSPDAQSGSGPRAEVIAARMPEVATVQPAESSVSVPPDPAAAGAPVASRDVLDLPNTVVQVVSDQSVAKVWVRRRGNLNGPVTFQWWTETGSAQSERDFAQVIPRWEVIGDGAAGIELVIPLVTDHARTQRRAFYVKIDRVGSTVSLGSRTLAQVEILPAMPEPLAVNFVR